jgi:alkanesulfonate monooxygenase SsuD/methylene tetrahydromethanopterin reductase-like flavin-dependent oxidoreductase (luciferase family)
MARTIHLVSGERFILGIGSGWFERDFREYGYEFGTAASRLRALAHGLPVIKARLAELRPPAENMPILIGGSGERVTLRLVAEHADAWNTFGPPAQFRRKSEVLDDWCADVGRDPAEIERTVAIRPDEVGSVDAYVDAGAQHVIVMMGPPYDLDPVRQLL